jgi:hypothetical protein
MDIAHMSPDILIESYEPGHSVAAFCGAVLEAAAARAAAARTSPLVKRSSSKQIEDTHKRGAKLVRSLSGKVPQVHFFPLTIPPPPLFKRKRMCVCASSTCIQKKKA